ncbi:hypothetical protein KJ603_01860 [Patescibacteria group bacterium]|nr:hypothetical protein [Patescibacteria group bacterium]
MKLNDILYLENIENFTQKNKGGSMYCPRCGSYNFTQLFGGICEKVCNCCNKGINCTDNRTNKIQEDSVPIRNSGEAAELRRQYLSKND